MKGYDEIVEELRNMTADEISELAKKLFAMEE